VLVSPGESVSRVESLLAKVRAGSQEALGQVLETFRAYLLAVACEELDSELRAKVGPSDLVQETFCEAHRDFAAFRGQTEAELLVWLRRVLLNNIANVARRYLGTEKRCLSREIHADAGVFAAVEQSLPSDVSSPSDVAARNERLARVERALGMLSAPHREVIVCRSLERQSFAQIAQKMGRSEKAVQKLWTRAIQELQHLLAPET
jgi:RNA polymerase sigma-70 factor (ECF subfamily)